MMDIDKQQILEYWHEWNLPDKIPVKLARDLNETDIKLIKDASHRSVWIIQAPTHEEPFPIILKLCGGSRRYLSEPILYKELQGTAVEEVIPKMYALDKGRTEHGILMFMECLKVASKREIITPQNLFKIAPALAQLHAETFETKPISEKIQTMVPRFMNAQREKKIKELQSNLEKAKKYPQLKKIIDDVFPEINEVAKLNFDFPEVIESGSCLTHGDLTLNNIGYEGDLDGYCHIKFIDYGAAVYAPCWLDLVKLIESPLDHHTSWDAEKLRRGIITHYVIEMNNLGITFKHDPMDLYRLAFIMRMFEYEFRRNLAYAIKRDGKSRFVFPRILKKIGDFSKELKLLD